MAENSSPSTLLRLPAVLPVMLLSDCFLFPGCCLPLFIFEERYRQMLAHALSTHRMFCIGARKGQTDDPRQMATHSTVGLIRACVKAADGTSQLLLVGLQRVRFTRLEQTQPFVLAGVEPVVTTRGSDEAALSDLKTEALNMLPDPGPESCATMRELKNTLRGADPELVCDVLAYHFVHCCDVLSRLQAEHSLERRYELVMRNLDVF